MSTPVHTETGVPPQIGRLRQRALGVGLVAAAACAFGAVTNPTQFFHSYLVAYLFWVGVGIGCLSITMIQHLTGGLWGLTIRRFLEAGARTLFFAVLFFLPLVAGLPRVYVWANPQALAADAHLHEAVERKAIYLNSPFFLGRAAFYFAAWCLLAHFLSKWSLAQDAGWSQKNARRLRGLSGGGLLLMGFTITFASVDWAMSLDPRWFSTIYGILFMVGQALSAMALMIVLLAALADEPPLAGVVSSQTLHDLGKLLFAFVMLWAYVSFSQFLIVWSGNLPEEIPWYVHRFGGGWQWLGLLLVVFHFALPFLLLLSRDLKRNARTLGTVAVGVLVVRLFDVFWLVAPELNAGGLAVHWLDVAAALAVGGLWLALYAWQLGRGPLLPRGDPELAEALASAPGH